MFFGGFYGASPPDPAQEELLSDLTVAVGIITDRTANVALLQQLINKNRNILSASFAISSRGVSRLSGHPNQSVYYLLRVCAEHHNLDAFEMLIENGANVNLAISRERATQTKNDLENIEQYSVLSKAALARPPLCEADEVCVTTTRAILGYSEPCFWFSTSTDKGIARVDLFYNIATKRYRLMGVFLKSARPSIEMHRISFKQSEVDRYGATSRCFYFDGYQTVGISPLSKANDFFSYLSEAAKGVPPKLASHPKYDLLAKKSEIEAKIAKTKKNIDKLILMAELEETNTKIADIDLQAAHTKLSSLLQ